MKKLIMIMPVLLFTLTIHAQREKGGGIITQDQVRKITELVKPIRDQLERQISADPRYLAYVDDVKRLEASTNKKEKSSLGAKIKDKYSSFFKDVWSSAKIDEAGYQNKIRRVFPTELANLIQFSDFLSFSINSSSFSSKSQALDSPGPDQCQDVCGIAVGEIVTSSALVGMPSGSWGKCYLSTDAMSLANTQILVGTAESNGYLRNGITIPGTFADDTRNLHVKLSFALSQSVMCFAFFGGGYAETRVQTFSSNEFLIAYAPILWYAESFKNKTINENYVLLKKNISLSSIWSISKTVTIQDGSDMGWTNCSNINWTVCEQK